MQVGILLYDEVEVLDFAGPFEVFGTAARVHARRHPEQPPRFQVATLTASGRPVRTRGGLRVAPEFTLDAHPPLDLVLVPGGVVTAELDRPGLAGWLRARAATARITASVCTGAFLLGRAGLLEGRRATTHWEDVADLRAFLPDTEVVAGARWVDEGPVVTSAGISAGLDLSLHLVERLAGRELAVATARQMDYAWNEDPGPAG